MKSTILGTIAALFTKTAKEPSQPSAEATAPVEPQPQPQKEVIFVTSNSNPQETAPTGRTKKPHSTPRWKQPRQSREERREELDKRRSEKAEARSERRKERKGKR
jgi:hypothetical protein